MQQLVVFNNITLDGFFAAPDGDIGWAHGAPNPEFDAFVAENASGGGMLLLGRITYHMMVKWWPTPMAAAQMPVVAEGMNRMPKVVFSRTMDRAEWSNTIVKGDLAAAVRRMKNESGPGMAILGSGSIVAQLAGEGLIDEYHVVVNPVVLGRGRTMFDGVTTPLGLRLARSRVFGKEKVFLGYQPAG